MEEDDLVWRVALKGWCCWFQGPPCCSRISQLVGRLMVGVFVGKYLVIIGRSPLIIYWPVVCFNSNNCHGCHTLYRMPCVDECVIGCLCFMCLVMQHTVSFLHEGVTIDILTSVHCQFFHFVQIWLTLPSFMFVFPSLQHPYTHHKNSLLAHKHKQFY